MKLDKQTQNGNERITFGIQLCYLWLLFQGVLNPNSYSGINSFDRMIGRAATYGVSVAKNVANMYAYSFGALAAVFLVWILLERRAPKGRSCCPQRQWELAAIWSLCGIARMLVLYIAGEAPGWELGYGDAVLAVGTVVQLIFLGAGISTRGLLMPFLFPAGVLPLFWAAAATFSWNVPWVVSALLYGIMTIGMLWVEKYRYPWGSRLDLHLIAMSCWPLALSMGVLSLFYEARILLAQHGTIVALRGRHIFLLALGMLLLCIVRYFFLLRRRDSLNLETAERRWYILLIAGFALLAGQMPVTLIAENELFESANTGMAIVSFFQQGQLPIIENFGAHMLQDFLPSAFYAWLSGDTLGALWYGYSRLIVVALELFLFLKLFLPPWVAACLVIAFPWQGDFALARYYGAVLIVYLLFYRYLQKDTLGRQMALWLFCGGIVLYALDLGTAISLGIALVALVSLLCTKQWKKLARTLGTGILSVVLVLGTLALCGAYKGVALVPRTLELLSTAFSNETWGNPYPGEYGQAYFAAYLLIPAAILLVSIRLLFYWKDSGWTDHRAGMLLAMGVTYLTNYQRGIVRHSVANGYNNSFPLLGTAILFLTTALWYCWSKQEKSRVNLKFAGCYMVMLLGLTLAGGANFYYQNILLDGLGNQVWYQEYSQPLTQTRTQIPPELEEVYLPVKNFMDETLEPDQTFIDFTNDTLLYALTEREKPMYVNQSPGLVNGEYGQKAFIEECRKADSVYLITFTDFEKGSLDSLSFWQRYYLIGEYLSQNYTPLCMVSQYTIWCRNDCLEAQRAKLEGLEEVEPLAPEEEHVHTLRYLPLVWGEKDNLEAQPIQTLLEQGTTGAGQAIVVPMAVSAQDKEEGNYIQFTLTFEGEQENMSLSLLQEGQSVAQFQFKVKAGTHRYKIRVSGDPAWYQSEIDSISLLLWGDQTAQVEQLTLCRGDSLVEVYES